MCPCDFPLTVWALVIKYHVSPCWINCTIRRPLYLSLTPPCRPIWHYDSTSVDKGILPHQCVGDVSLSSQSVEAILNIGYIIILSKMKYLQELRITTSFDLGFATVIIARSHQPDVEIEYLIF